MIVDFYIDIIGLQQNLKFDYPAKPTFGLK